MSRKRVVVIGGGPAGLMAAFRLMEVADVTVVDHKKHVGRKFLVAGDGGFNLTHSEQTSTFIEKYDSDFVRSCVSRFDAGATREWLKTLGIETRIGSSGKIFPAEGIKPVAVLNAILAPLKKNGVRFLTETQLVDFSPGTVRVESAGRSVELDFDFLVFAMGGASWKRTGSTGEWLELFRKKGISVSPFRSSNSGIELQSMDPLAEFEGSQVKNVRITFGGQSVAGDLTITAYGLEGKPVYAAGGWLRNNHFSGMTIDFKPQLSETALLEKLRAAGTVRNAFKMAHIPLSVYHWLRAELDKEAFTDFASLARHLKAFSPQIRGLRPIDEVISVVGGVNADAISGNGELLGFNAVYCCGEMLNWDAPTGGYLLQACFSTAVAVSDDIRSRIADSD